MNSKRSWLARLNRPAIFLILCTGLLTLGFAPISLFYLAWIGLVPWILLLKQCSTQKSAFFWSWIAGTIFFTANMWWMANISLPGMIALMIFCGFYWAMAALVIRGSNLLDGNRTPMLAGVLGISSVWVCFEWLRGYFFTGLPWLYLGHTQTPALILCQIADITGVYGISFWIVALNALLALAWINRGQAQKLVPSIAMVGILTATLLTYGSYRIRQTPLCLSPGPVVAVVQPNYPQDNSGEKGAPLQDRLDLLSDQTIEAARKHPGIDLFVWPETMMWALNFEARENDPVALQNYQILGEITGNLGVNLLTGADYAAHYADEIRGGLKERIPADRRNSAYLFDALGRMDDSLGHRYDKIHLVPWGEYIPFKETFPPLYRLSLTLGPKYYSDYELQPGADDALTVFHLQAHNGSYKFVTPICFEDIDSRICARMFRPEKGGAKRADFLINVTNDGWFKANQNAQQLQAATFRSIENRVWSARSVNTGISGFIDSTGQTSDLLQVRAVGTSVREIKVDSRITFYTRFGDCFAGLTVVATGVIALFAWINRDKSSAKSSRKKS